MWLVFSQTLTIQGRNNRSRAHTNTWINDWKRFELRLERHSEKLDIENIESSEDDIVEWGSKYFSMLIALMPVEEIKFELNIEDVKGLPEGSKTTIEVNRYERSSRNRSLCLSVYGYQCKVCNFNFEKVYGEIGMGYIHVHHIKPVSEILKIMLLIRSGIWCLYARTVM